MNTWQTKVSTWYSSVRFRAIENVGPVFLNLTYLGCRSYEKYITGLAYALQHYQWNCPGPNVSSSRFPPPCHPQRPQNQQYITRFRYESEDIRLWSCKNVWRKRNWSQHRPSSGNIVRITYHNYEMHSFPFHHHVDFVAMQRVHVTRIRWRRPLLSEVGCV